MNILFELLNGIRLLILNVSNPNTFPKPLKSEEEMQYLKRMQNGDKKAREVLIEHNLRLVAHIVKKYYSVSGDTDDLISIGTIGLIKGIDSYNLDKNVRLSSYISRCIENEILMFFRSTRKSAQDISISEPIDTDKDGNAMTLIDVIATEDTIAEDIDTKIKIENLGKFMNQCLDERERKVIIMRYGLDGKAPMPQRTVAEKLNISRSYVSRIEKKALEELKKKYM